MFNENHRLSMPARGGSAFGGKAVILAGGKGTRLGSLTADIPKPLIAIGEKPVLEHQILLLQKYGITDIALLVGHLAHDIEEYCGDGSRWGVSISYEREQEPLGTAGALRVLERKIKEDFLLLSGDVMTNINVARFADFHSSKKESVATAAIRDTVTPLHSDLIQIDEQSRITRIHLRPHPEGDIPGKLGIASLYVLSPRFFNFIPAVGKCDIEKEVFPQILRNGGALYGYYTQEYIRDMGTPDRLMRVRADYENGIIYHI